MNSERQGMWNGMENGIKLVVQHPVPSLNRLFAMNPWQRRREKIATQAAFASALSASGLDSAIRITFARNTSLTAFVTQGSSRMTRRIASRLKSARSDVGLTSKGLKS
jgi:hypothetical protein